MSVFSLSLNNNINALALIDDKDPDYPLFCLEYNKIVTKYIINQDLHSKIFWEYLTTAFNLTDEKYVLQKTEVSVDEKNRQRKTYKYYVRALLNPLQWVYLVFYDEYRNLTDDDFHNYATAEDKSDKVNRLVIYYDPEQISTKSLEEEVVSKIMACVYVPAKKNQFFTINASSFGGFELRSSYIKEMNGDLDLHYGEKFSKLHTQIVSKLRDQKHGLFLFHGDPGTGKTSYIRRLINELSENKTIIYVPTYMMQSMADPELISFISGFRDTILLLEDSENVLGRSVDDRTQAIANILNMTDGLLNDHMEVQIIATFNTDAKLIDPALKRAGRLMVNYKFGKLAIPAANKLAKHLGLTTKFEKAATLAEIYEGANQIVAEDDLSPRTIGFHK